MTPEERITEISEMCGYSTETVRTILKAEAESVAKSLIKGEHGVLSGRCILKPRVRDGVVKVSCTVSTSLLRTIQEQSDIEKIANNKATVKYVAVEQIEGLV